MPLTIGYYYTLCDRMRLSTHTSGHSVPLRTILYQLPISLWVKDNDWWGLPSPHNSSSHSNHFDLLAVPSVCQATSPGNHTFAVPLEAIPLPPSSSYFCPNVTFSTRPHCVTPHPALCIPLTLFCIYFLLTGIITFWQTLQFTHSLC